MFIMFSMKRKLPRAIVGTRLASQSTLMSNPFRVSGSLPETDDLFAPPKLLSFDAFGTLYVPKKPVAQQYHDIAKEHGIDLPVDTIAGRFSELHAELLEQFPNYGKDSSQIASAEDWWKRLITNVFELDGSKHQDLSQILIDHFTGPGAYKVYSDVEPALKALKGRGVNMVVSSNSDSRNSTILKNLGLAKYFDNIHMSYDLGVEKPSKKFFDLVARKQGQTAKSYDRLWHVGDHRDKDFIGAVRAGWNGVLLDREKTSGYFGPHAVRQESSISCSLESVAPTDTSERVVVANNRVVLTSLEQLVSLYDY